jgi:adenylate cyclase
LLVDVYLNLGWSYSRLGQEAKAIPLLQDALSIAQTLGDLSAQSWALNNLGTIYFGMKDLEEAIAYHQQALNIRCEIDPDGLLVGRSLQNLASICLGVENWKSALSYAKKALSIQQRVEDQFGLSYTLRILATYYEKKANRNRALELLEQSLLIRRNLGAKKEVADTLLDMADIYHKENMPEKAATCLKEVAAIESELDQQGDEND